MKKFWQSKTVLVNVVGAVVLYFLNLQDVGTDPTIVAAVAAAINVILRFITKEPISVK